MVGLLAERKEGRAERWTEERAGGRTKKGGRGGRRIAWVSHWGRRDKPPRQVLWLRQALVYTLGHLLEPLPVMSSQRCVLVTVVMVRGMVVVVV